MVFGVWGASFNFESLHLRADDFAQVHVRS